MNTTPRGTIPTQIAKNEPGGAECLEALRKAHGFLDRLWWTRTQGSALDIELSGFMRNYPRTLAQLEAAVEAVRAEHAAKPEGGDE